MECPTIDAGAKLANSELRELLLSDYFPRDYASKSELLARLKNNRLPTSIDIPTHRIDVSCGVRGSLVVREVKYPR